MADSTDYDLLREDVGATAAQLDNTAAEAIFTTVETEYSDNADAIYAAARVTYLRRSWAQATNLSDYVQNEESERLGQIAARKRELLEYWEGKLDDALAEAERPKGQAAMVFTAAGPTRRSCTLWP